ncbi:MAG: OB-fold putative lipoprotein [Bacteroidales bacterium]|nr:OB-fold putative lipoprotein [Bacteroidales bacterium]
MKAEQEEEAKQVAAGPEMTVTAQEVYAAYKDNEIAADQKYKGKVLEMSGTVDGVKPDHIELKAGNVFAQVNIYFADSEKAKAAKLAKGSHVTVRGKCGGKQFVYPYLESAILVSE